MTYKVHGHRMHSSTVFPQHCMSWVTTLWDTLKPVSKEHGRISISSMFASMSKKGGRFPLHGKLYQTVFFRIIKPYRDWGAFRLLNSGLWLDSSMTSLVSPPNSKTNSNICLSQIFHLSVCLFQSHFAWLLLTGLREWTADSGNSCLLSVFIMILPSTRQGIRRAFSEAVHTKVIFRGVFEAPPSVG